MIGFLATLTEDPRVRDRLVRWKTTLERLCDDPAIDGEDAREAASIVAFKFVRDELGQPWPWLASELLEMCILDRDPRKSIAVNAIAADVDHVVLPWRLFVEAPAETFAEARDRVRRAADEALSRLTKMEVESKTYDAELRRLNPQQRWRGPKGDGAIQRDWGRWFYEARVRKPRRGISEIAGNTTRHRNHSDSDLLDCGCRGDVRHGIKEAARLFNLIPYPWGRLDPPDR